MSKADSHRVRILTSEEIEASVALLDGVCSFVCGGRIAMEIHYRYNGSAGRATHVRRKVCRDHGLAFASRHSVQVMK